MYIYNSCCSFFFFFFTSLIKESKKRFKKILSSTTVSTLIINQNIRIISEGSCDTEYSASAFDIFALQEYTIFLNTLK